MEGNLFILFLPSRTIYNNKNLSFSPRMSRKNIQHLPFEYNTIIFGEDRKIGVGLLFRTKPVPNKNLDGSRRATGSSAGCRRLTSLITSDRGKRIPATSTFSLLSSLLATQAIDEAKCARSWADEGNR